MGYFARRRACKQARETLRHARHIRNLREDVLPAGDLADLDRAERGLREALRAGTASDIQRRGEELYGMLARIAPARPSAWMRENVEVLVVAIAVAMAFRTYFLQPFKIPTGSMEPTLYGIKVRSDVAPTILDRVPLKLVKWFWTGQWYREVRAQTDGYVSMDLLAASGDGTTASLIIGGRRHKVPSRGHLRVRLGEHVRKGTVLWAGTTTAGDHVLVDKVRWNFFRPRRGEVMVFSTEGIAGLLQGTHYIKRMSGLPNEEVSIDPPRLKVNGVPVTEPASMARIADQAPGYEAGYQLVDPRTAGSDPCYLASPNQKVLLGPGEYLALGDNTTNSRDSRYWGPVRQRNLVGPACLVYWPFSKRWGLIE